MADDYDWHDKYYPQTRAEWGKVPKRLRPPFTSEFWFRLSDFLRSVKGFWAGAWKWLRSEIK